MPIRDTSRTAYHGVDLTSGQARVIAFLLRHSTRADWTRNEISAVGAIPINRVCPRVLELIELGLLDEHPSRVCQFSGHSAHPVALRAAQAALPFEATGVDGV